MRVELDPYDSLCDICNYGTATMVCPACDVHFCKDCAEPENICTECAQEDEPQGSEETP